MERARSSGPKSLAHSPGKAAVKPTARSQITNGKRLFVGVDGRSRQARRWRDLFRGFMAETGGRSEVECRSLASLTLQREAIDAALARGETIDVGELVKLTGAIGRVMVRVGLVADAAAPDATDEVLRRIRTEAA